MDDEHITARQFHDAGGTDGWHVLYGGAQAVYLTGTFDRGVEFTSAIVVAVADLGREPDVDVRPHSVAVRTFDGRGALARADVEVARRVSALARERGLAPDEEHLQTVALAIAQADGVDSRPFWEAALGFERAGARTVDPLRRGFRVWFDSAPTPGRGRTHVDIAVPADRAPSRVAAALAAGGRVASDADVPEWWTLASPDNHGIDIAAWVDVDEGE